MRIFPPLALALAFLAALAIPCRAVEIIIDDAAPSGVTITGSWSPSTSVAGFYGTAYLHDSFTDIGTKSVRFTPAIVTAGIYQVYFRWTAHSNRASNVPVDIVHAGGTDQLIVNQRTGGGVWTLLGTYNFNAGTAGSVLISNDATNGYVIADAVRFVSTTRYEAETASSTASDAAAIVADTFASNGAVQDVASDAVADYITYTMPVPQPGTYAVKVRARKGPDAAIFQLEIDGANQASAQDRYSETAAWVESSLGSKTFGTPGDKAFKFTVSGKNGAGSGYRMGFDYIELQPFVDGDGDGMPNDWETAHGLNPNSSADAGQDPDGDGATNLQEYQAGTDPNIPNGGTVGTVAVSVEAANAYEKEGTAARVKITRTGGTAAVTVKFNRSGTAGAADYTTTDANNAVLSGAITLAAGATSASVLIKPAADALSEYPEPATITLTADPGYTIGAPSSATVTIYDATDIPANEQLFTAHLAPVAGTNSTASGIGTMYLNGPKTSARVSLSFNGLTSGQTNAYIRYGVTSGTGTELRPNLGVGQLNDVLWTIVPVATLTGQQIIDGLYQVGGKWVYTNIGTGNYPGGEIQGTWGRQTGSSTFTPPAAPPSIPALAGDELTRDVVRFLMQTTFGPTQAEVDALVNSINTTHGGNRIAAFSAWIDTQLSYEQTSVFQLNAAFDRQNEAARGLSEYQYGPSNRDHAYAWWTASLAARDQLRLRYSFAMGEIMVISMTRATFGAFPYAMTTYYDMLGSYASAGTFRNMLEAISKHPAMGSYLSSIYNRKATFDANGDVLTSPDENYAREIMQLFSIGVLELHPDGSLKLDSTGQAIQTYDNDDIVNLARVFTGWSFSKTHSSVPPYDPVDNNHFYRVNGGSSYEKHFQYNWRFPMKNFGPDYHDTGSKTVLGSTIAAGLDGEADLDAALDIICNHPNVGPFISRLLIQRLVTSNPSNGYVYRVAQKFADNGSGVRGDMKAVIKAILLDYEARATSLTANVGYGKQKEPIVRFAQLMRTLNGKSQMPLSDLAAHGFSSAQLANFPSGATVFRLPATDSLVQTPFAAPSVFNWFLPDYNPGGAIGEAGLVAPEMQITTESSVVSAINQFYTLVKGANGLDCEELYGYTDGAIDNVRLDYTQLVSIYDARIAVGQTVTEATTAVLDYLDLLLMAGDFKARYSAAPTPNPRSILISASSGTTLSTTLARVQDLVYAVAATPEYIHQQ